MRDSSSKRFEGSETILLVDDNPHGLAARQVVLEELGYKTRTAESAEEALNLIGAERFDLVVTDYRMPQMNGVDLIRTLREGGSRTPVILLSGFVEPLGLTEESTGADAVIPKSWNEVNQLLRAVKRLLHGGIPRRPAGSQGGGKSRTRTARS